MRFVARPDSGFEVKADLVLLAMGFVGPEQGRPAVRAGREDDGPRQRLARRQLDDERARASSPPATCSAASHSSSGRLRMAAAPRGAWTRT